MRVNPLDLTDAFAVSLPVLAISLVAIAVVSSRLKQFISKPKRSRKRWRFAISAVNAAMLLAFLPFASIYRPSMIQVAKAQTRQQEDVDEDDSGEPESPVKHLLRQLRRIRQGEKVEILFVRRK
jgi:hypothetical protein